MTDCGICGKPVGVHEPWLDWHTGWDGCDECDADYEKGVILCRVCVTAMQYARGFDVNAYVPDLDEYLDEWAHETLWNAVWDPRGLTVGEASAAREWLDRMGREDADPAVDWLPYDSWDTRGEFAREAGAILLRRFGLGESDMDRLASACLTCFGGWWGMVSPDPREVERRLRDA